MKQNTTNPSTPHRMTGLLLALGAGVAAYAWRRKVTGKPVLPSLAAAVAVATGANPIVHNLARRFFLNSNADPLPVDGRLADANEEHVTPRKGKEYNP